MYGLILQSQRVPRRVGCHRVRFLLNDFVTFVVCFSYCSSVLLYDAIKLLTLITERMNNFLDTRRTIYKFIRIEQIYLIS